jgi:Domain of unknown function (DUF6265)
MRSALLFILVLYIGPVSAQKNSSELATQFESLKWLEGKWQRTNVKPGIKAHEEWHAAAHDEFKGLGVTMKESDTVFLEKIKIVKKDGNIYYVADVRENRAPVYFKFTSLTSHGFICENPEHDFPKKIEYRLSKSDLTVTISAGGKSEGYLFTRL